MPRQGVTWRGGIPAIPITESLEEFTLQNYILTYCGSQNEMKKFTDTSTM
uniref:Uncharacterized protein n=1 Tax=Anguilla anguilla TaxID=7936 RepID=A0A0E9WBE9_ANGAN